MSGPGGDREQYFFQQRNPGNTLVSINAVALHWARLLPGWVTVCWKVHLGTYQPPSDSLQWRRHEAEVEGGAKFRGLKTEVPSGVQWGYGGQSCQKLKSTTSAPLNLVLVSRIMALY